MEPNFTAAVGKEKIDYIRYINDINSFRAQKLSDQLSVIPCLDYGVVTYGIILKNLSNSERVSFAVVSLFSFTFRLPCAPF